MCVVFRKSHSINAKYFVHLLRECCTGIFPSWNQTQSMFEFLSFIYVVGDVHLAVKFISATLHFTDVIHT